MGQSADPDPEPDPEPQHRRFSSLWEITMRRAGRLNIFGVARMSKGSDCGVDHFRVAGTDPDPELEH
jgi:hypothetical protein